MTTLYDGYATPAFVILGKVEDGALVEGFYDGSSGQNDSPLPFVVEQGQTVELHPVWYSTYTGAQVQYRVRHRLNYAAGLLEDDTGAEVWTDFPDWTEPSGATPTAECTYTTSLGYSGKRRYAPGITLSYSYDLSQYDLHEVEVRVRVYSTAADRASEWAYGTCRIAFRPQLVSYTAQTTANGSLELTYESNWARGTELRIDMALDAIVDGKRIWRSASEKTVAEGIPTAFGALWLVQADADRKGALWAAYARIDSADTMAAGGRDGGCSSVADPLGGYLFEPGAHVDPQDVPTPAISISQVESAQAVVEIACACDHVVARAEYEVDGRLEVVELDIAGASPDWTATLDAPPLGVPITIKAACCNASGQYKLATVEVSAITAAHSILTGDGDTIVLRYNGEFSSDTERTAEAVQTVGRKLPVSRHGVSVKRDISVKGTILFPSVFANGDMELSALSVLDNPHDWVYRNPKGMRKRVMVRSWGFDQDTSQLGRLAEVTIAMEEVE